MITDDVDYRRARASSVVEVRQAIGEAWSSMQQGCRRSTLHPPITVSRAGDHSLEEANHAPHGWPPVERRHKVHLGGSGIGKTDVNAVGEQHFAKSIGSVHAFPRAHAAMLKTSYSPARRQ